jgi:hypothetical protein
MCRSSESENAEMDRGAYAALLSQLTPARRVDFAAPVNCARLAPQGLCSAKRVESRVRKYFTERGGEVNCTHAPQLQLVSISRLESRLTVARR